MNENPSRSWRLRVANFIRWHRRALAAVAAGVAVFAGLGVLAPPDPSGVAVVVASVDLPAGHRVGAADVRVVEFPEALVPAGAATDPAELVGEVLVGQAPRGTPLGPASVVGTDRLPPGRMLVPVRVDDPAVLGLLGVGDVISVMGSDASGTPVVLARSVRIAAAPAATSDSGPLGGGASGGMVVVDVDEATALKLGAWSSNPGLSISLG